jgi:hypothetical protein
MRFYKAFIECLDIPSGSVVGMYTLAVIAMSVHAYLGGREVPASVITLYQFVVGAFAGSKAVKTIWGKKQTEAPNNQENKTNG